MNKLTVLFTAAVLLLSGCTPVVPDDTTGTADTTGQIQTEVTKDMTDSTAPDPVTTAENYETVWEAGASKADIVYASEYGAVGDGVTDDGPALTKAFNAAVSKRGTLMLDKDRVYYVASSSNTTNGFISPFAVEGKGSFTVNGNGSVISVKPGITYMAVVNCRDAVFENVIFRYNTPVYLCGTVTAVSGKAITFSTDIEPNTKSACSFNGVGFTIQYNEGVQQRPHRFFTQMENLGDKTVKITYNDANVYKKGDKVFLPNPYIGHMIGEVVYIAGNSRQMIFRNINIQSAPSFVCAIKGNKADILLENFDLMYDRDNPREINMVAWRDGYHCKDNRGRLIWEGCDTGVLFDDVCNVACTVGQILNVVSETELEVTNKEFYVYQNRIVGYDVKVGDVVDVYCTTNARYSGRATVTAVKSNKSGSVNITLDTPLKNVTGDFVVGNQMTAAPGSLMNNCTAQGTYRFRGAITVRKCDFKVLIIWIMVEGEVEGPIPQNIVFEDCTLSGGTIQIEAYDRTNGRYSRPIGQQIKDIVFRGCNITGEFTGNTRSEYTVIE